MRPSRVRGFDPRAALGTLPTILSSIRPSHSRRATRNAPFGFDFEPTSTVWWVELLVVGGLIHAGASAIVFARRVKPIASRGLDVLEFDNRRDRSHSCVVAGALANSPGGVIGVRLPVQA